MTIDEAIKAVPIEKDIPDIVLEYAKSVRALTTIFDDYKQQQKELHHLQQENEQLRELLRLSVKSIYGFNDCEDCIHNDKGSECPHCTDVLNWQWQHAHKLKGLGIEV